MIHLICGPIGAGKTTYAHELVIKHNAIRFSEDEWLSQLFVPDAPQNLMSESMEVIGAWAHAKYARCREQIHLISEQLLNQNINIILDGAAANKEQRDNIRKLAIKHNVGFQLHYVNADASKRKERVLERNIEQGKTYSLEVTPDVFHHMEDFFEAPKEEELTDLIVITT